MNDLKFELTKQVLLIEDNPIDVMLIRRSLGQAGIPFAATIIEDGDKAMNFISACTPDQKPDLVIVDLNLPVYDGFEIVEAIKKNPVLAGVPYVILSSSVSQKDRDRAAKIGVEHFVTKPLGMDEFLKTGLFFKALLGM